MSTPVVITDKKYEQIKMITRRHQDLVRDFDKLYEKVHRNTTLLNQLFTMIGDIDKRLENRGTATIFNSAMVEQTKLKRFENDEI